MCSATKEYTHGLINSLYQMCVLLAGALTQQEELQRQSFESALAAAARERENEKHCSTDNMEKKDSELTNKRTRVLELSY